MYLIRPREEHKETQAFIKSQTINFETQLNHVSRTEHVTKS